MKKIIISYSAILLIIISCSGNKTVKTVESWKAGTSSGLFTDFSQEEFNQFRKDGIEYIELSSGIFGKKTQAQKDSIVSDLKKKTDIAGIKIWSVHLPFGRALDISNLNDTLRNNMIKECSELMVLCKPLNIQKYVVHPSAEPITDEERPQRIINSIASLKLLSETAKQNGAQLAVEDLPRTCLGNTADELIYIVKQAGNDIGICFDSNHLLKEKPEEFAAKVSGMIVTVHISDYDGIDERHWLPGTGIINWTNVISELAKSGYPGPFMFEASKRKPSADGTADASKLTIKELYASFAKIKTGYIESVSSR
jgi:sugar phosphate isomerase/epimerase